MEEQWFCLWVGQSCKICWSSRNKQAGACALPLLYLLTVKKPLWIFCLSSCFACRTNIHLFHPGCLQAPVRVQAWILRQWWDWRLHRHLWRTLPEWGKPVCFVVFGCLLCFLLCLFVRFIYQEIQFYSLTGSLREGQVWSCLLSVCGEFHRRGLWIKVRVCLHCWR